jgi:quercetin dioxygenase-like cupin family protein
MRSRRFVLTLAIVTTCIVSASPITAQQAPQPSDHAAGMHVYPSAEIPWKDGPGSLPAGARFAVLEGDPAKDGQFTMRLRLPDGFRIAPHFHSGVEHVTVVSGTFNVGMGDKFDQATAKRMPAGTFGFWPAGMRHFAWTEGETILQLHGLGPWTITYVNPADDPRTKK